MSDSTPDNITIICDQPLAAKLGLSLVTLWRLRQDPKSGFLQKIPISKGIGGTRAAEVAAWLEKRSGR